jgi:signal transduction histidine kinase/CheY-like chemotaxis protein
MKSKNDDVTSLEGNNGNLDEGVFAFEDLFDLGEIQKIQDAFAEATGVASVITRPDGRPLTQPSHFCHLCINIIRKTPKGLENCMFSDAVLGRPHQGGPIVQRCLSGGLLDAGCSIFAGDQHVANWLIGQVLDSEIDTRAMLSYAEEIGVERSQFAEALEDVPRMPHPQFAKVAQALYLVANQLSLLALQNMQKAKELQARKRAEEALLLEKKMTAIVESELTKHRDHLEMLVAARTDELQKRNAEIEHKNADLERTRAELARKAEALERSSRYKSEFLSNISHELKTPLNSILILSGLLSENKAGHLDEREVSHAKTIHGAGSNLLHVVNDILDVAAFDDSCLEHHFEPVSLAGLVQWIDSQFRPQATAKGLQFVTFLAPDLPDAIVSDESSLKKMVGKVVENAIKFTQLGSVEVHLKPGSVAGGTSGSFAICVSDTGIGIPSGDMNSIFDAFRQGDGSLTRRFGGLGLGLAIADKLAHYLGGSIRVSSSPQGNGSIFAVLLPADGRASPSPDKPPTPPAPPAVASENPAPPPPAIKPTQSRLLCDPVPQLAGRRVVLVDTDVRNVFLLTGALEKLEMVVNPFTDPQEALRHLSLNANTDFVLMDESFLAATKDGISPELLKQEPISRVPVLLMTQETEKGGTRHALPQGIAGSIQNPVEMKLLTGLLCSLLPR